MLKKKLVVVRKTSVKHYSLLIENYEWVKINTEVKLNTCLKLISSFTFSNKVKVSPIMGSASSSISQSQLLSIINQVTIKNMQDNGINTSDVQEITIDGNYNVISNVTESSTQTAELLAWSAVDNQQTLANQIAAALSAISQANAGPLGFFSSSKSTINEQQAANIISNAMISNIQNCASTSNSFQGINVTGKLILTNRFFNVGRKF